VFFTLTAVGLCVKGERVASDVRSFIPAKHTTLAEHMPPAHHPMARRPPDRLRRDATTLGEAIGGHVNRLVTARDHPEQGVRACLGALRLAKSYGQARLELVCERALAVSLRYVEQALKVDWRVRCFSTHRLTTAWTGTAI